MNCSFTQVDELISLSIKCDDQYGNGAWMAGPILVNKQIGFHWCLIIYWWFNIGKIHHDQVTMLFTCHFYNHVLLFFLELTSQLLIYICKIGLPVISYVENTQALREVLYIWWSYPLQKVYVVIRVKATHVMCRSSIWPVYLQNGQIQVTNVISFRA